jgi:uncharacterized protein YfaS (alpha-2-macroglobulin family)
MNRTLILSAIGALIVGFGGGLLTAKVLSPHTASTATPVSTDSGLWSLFGHPRAADAPRRGSAKPDTFAVWQSRVDTSGPAPLACVQMSRPLDPSRAYGDFVLVSPDLGHPPAVVVKDDSLCIGGLGFTDRKVTLLRGLPDKAGDTLADNADVDFTFGEKPPYVGFAGEGVILPREDSDGVGIETINVTKLSVEVWRVPDRNLVRKSISAPTPTAEGSYADDYGDDSPDDEGRVVWKGFVSVKGDPGARTTTVFPLGAVLKSMAPGGYVIKARDASGARAIVNKDSDSDESADQPAQARRWVIFTDMALTAFTGSRSLDVVVRSLKTARTLTGLPVALVARDGETLATVRTGDDGRATFPHALLQGDGASTPKMLMAYGASGDLAVLDLDRSPVDLSKQAGPGHDVADASGDITAGRTPKTAIDGYLYADRGIYRPGEKAHLTALVRDDQSRAVDDRRGYIEVLRPSGVEYRRYAFTGTGGGAVLADVVLPASSPRGKWTAELHVDGFDDPAASLSFSVEDFVPQRLAVTAGGHAETPVGAGETRAVDVTARFLYGAIGSGLKTQGEARLRADPNPFPQYADFDWGDDVKPFQEQFVDLGTTATDGAGKADLALPSDKAGDRRSVAGRCHGLGVRAGRPAGARKRQPEGPHQTGLPGPEGRRVCRHRRSRPAGRPGDDRRRPVRAPHRRARRHLHIDQ